MRSSEATYFQIGRRLMLIFAVLVAVILGGNGLVVWQFYLARSRTNHLTGANQQMILVLQLQVSLLSFHQRLEDLARSRDAQRMVVEAGPLLSALDEQTQRTRATLMSLPPEAPADPAFWPTLEAIQATLPAQQKAITELVKSSDWAAVQLRLGSALKPIETQTAILVESIGKQAGEELSQAVAEMKTVQRTILIIVPATAVCTFCIAAFFGWSIARRIIELRLEERVTERMRIARELHDTLLQSFQGSLLFMQSARNLLFRRPEQADKTLDDAISMAAGAIDQGRDAIQDLRSQAAVQSDLAQLLTATGQDLAHSGDANGNPVIFRVAVEGERQDLDPIIRDEAYRIARELLRNAFRHAQASQIEADIRYDDQLLRVLIRDDGKGIQREVVEAGGRPGHWGLMGMRERAKRIGARLEFWSEVGAGTEVELNIPASIAYAAPRSGRHFPLLRKKKADV